MQYVQQDVTELLSDKTVYDEVDGRVEHQQSVSDGVSTPQDVDVRLSTIGPELHDSDGATQCKIRQLTDDEDANDDHQRQSEVGRSTSSLPSMSL